MGALIEIDDLCLVIECQRTTATYAKTTTVKLQ